MRDYSKEPYRETFRTQFAQATEGDARGLLEKVREEHTTQKGWYEISAWTEQDPVTKLWRAVRVHEKRYWYWELGMLDTFLVFLLETS